MAPRAQTRSELRIGHALGGAPHEIETRAEPGQPRAVTIDGKSAPQAALGRLLRVLWLVPAMDRLWTEGAEGRRRFLDRMALSFAARADGVRLPEVIAALRGGIG